MNGNNVQVRSAEDLLGDLRGKRALDVGTGSGATAQILAARGAGVVTIDIKSMVIDPLVAAHPHICPVLVSDVRENGALPFASGAFDVIFARYVLQTSRDMERLLRFQKELYRVLSTGGVYVCEEGTFDEVTFSSDQLLASFEDSKFAVQERHDLIHEESQLPYVCMKAVKARLDGVLKGRIS